MALRVILMHCRVPLRSDPATDEAPPADMVPDNNSRSTFSRWDRISEPFCSELLVITEHIVKLRLRGRCPSWFTVPNSFSISSPPAIIPTSSPLSSSSSELMSDTCSSVTPNSSR